MPSPLFDRIPAGADADYQALYAPRFEHQSQARALCEDLWHDFEPLADQHYLSQFPLNFHQRWFEMYLTVTLLRRGFDVLCPKPGPDILLTVNQKRIWIEAVCATPGKPDLPDSVPILQVKPDQPPEARRVPIDQMALRMRASLGEKAQKFSQYVTDGVVQPDDLKVVAINVHLIPWAFIDLGQLSLRSLYGVGNHAVTLDRETGKIVGHHRETLTSIRKQNGAEVGVQPFVDGSMTPLSAVLASWGNVANIPTNGFGGDFQLFPNLTAAVPWTAGAIALGHEWRFSKEDEGWNGSETQHS